MDPSLPFEKSLFLRFALWRAQMLLSRRAFACVSGTRLSSSPTLRGVLVLPL